MLVFLFGVAALVGQVAATEVPAQTLSIDTRWTAAGSPYEVRGTVSVAAGATLTFSWRAGETGRTAAISVS